MPVGAAKNNYDQTGPNPTKINTDERIEIFERYKDIFIQRIYQ